MSEIVKEVGARVRRFRRKAGMSQGKLGELAGLHDTYIGQIERGEKSVSIEAIDKIIKALGLPYETFYAKINPSRETTDVAGECYDLISGMNGRDQRLVKEILQNIARMTEK